MNTPGNHLKALATQAIEELGRVVGNSPQRVAAEYAAGCLLELVDDPEAAIEAFKRAISGSAACTGDTLAMANTVEALRTPGGSGVNGSAGERGVTTVDGTIRTPEGPGIDGSAGERVLTDAGGTIRLLEAMARCAVGLGREVEVAGWLSQVRTAEPPRPELAIWEGYLFRLGGYHEKATEALAVALAQVTHPIYLAIAAQEQLTILFEMGRPHEVEQLLTAIDARDPALAEQLSGKFEQLLATIEARDPALPEQLAASGTVMRARRGRIEEDPCPKP